MASNPLPPGDITADRDMQRCWNEYVQHGKWTLEIPDDQGYYARGTRDGQFVDFVQVVTHYGDPYFLIGPDVVRSADSWKGYWWSMPLPMLPDPPDIT